MVHAFVSLLVGLAIHQGGALRIQQHMHSQNAMKMTVINGDEHGFLKENRCTEISQDQKQVKQNIIGKFKILLCRGDNLSGSFHIQKLMGCDKDLSEISADAETDHEAHLLGQDEFFLSLEGPEVRPLVSVSSEELLKTCTYDLPFELSVAGKYHVNLKWYREHFDSVKETSWTWPANHFDKPLGDNVYLAFGDSKQTLVDLISARSPKDLPTCDVHKLNKGRWVFMGNPSEIFAPPPDNRCGNLVETSGCLQGYLMNPKVHYKRYAWFADKCQHRQFTQAEAATCLVNKTIELRGDSYMRHLFYAIQKFACGYTGGQSKGGGCTSHPGKCKSICLVSDETGASPGSLAADLVVANFGQHNADGKHHDTLKTYKSTVDAYTSRLEDLMKGKQNFAWYETSIVPFRDDNWVYKFGDWRTGNRLRLYNNYANKKFTSLGVPILSTFEKTRAFSQHTSDNAHYPDEVIHPAVNDILNLMCP